MSNDSLIEIIEMTPAEMTFLHLIRTNLRFGEITATVRDGRIMRIRRITEVLDLQDTLDTRVNLMRK